MKFKKTYLAICIASQCVVSAVADTSESNNQGRTIEEVMVTAQKRSQSLQDVPISIAAISGDTLDSQVILSFDELAADLPNVEFVASPGLDGAIGMRGVYTSTGNPAFEQSVGVYSDGIYISRGRLYNLAFLDLENVEILRGPQGVLQGKNSVAGAVNFISRKPTDTFEGRLSGHYELEHGSYSGEAVISGPLSDRLRGRIALQEQYTGGYLDFPRMGEKDQNETESRGVRVSVEYDLSENSELLVRYDHQETEASGASFGPYKFQEGVREAYETLYESVDPDFGYVTSGVISNGKLLSVDDAGNISATNKLPSQGATVDMLSATYNLQLQNRAEITSISSYTDYSTHSVLVNTFNGIDWLTQGDDDEDEAFDQFTQEIRYASPGGETLDYVVGLYYLAQSLDASTDGTIIDATALGYPAMASFVQDIGFVQNTESISAFGQVTWNVSDVFRANLGLRETYESKEADGFLTSFTPDRNVVLDPGFNPLVDQFSTNWENKDKRVERSLDPSFSVQWDFSEDGMLYASWTSATKAGGFNAADSRGDNFEYEEESATSYEVGAKLSLLENKMQVNVAIFQSDYSDLQVNAWDASASSFKTGNAAEATIGGVEADFIYLVTNSLKIGSTFAYLDATYDDYPGASCSVGESEESDCIDGNRNASGDALRQAPEWSANVFAELSIDLSDSLELMSRISANSTDSYFMSATNDPYLLVDSYSKVDGQVSLISTDSTWSVSLLAKNLTNEKVPFFANSTPLFEDAYFSSVEVGREVFLKFDYGF